MKETRQADGGALPGQIHWQAALCAPDHDEHAAGAQQVGHALQAGSGVHVVQRRHARHQIEALRFERVREDIPAHVSEVGSGLRSGEIDASRVRIEAYDNLGPVLQLPGELSLAAADVERPAAPVRNRRKDKWGYWML